MLTLAADTSGKNGSLALARFEGNTQHTLDVVPIEGGTFSAQLIPQIAALLQRHHIPKLTVDAFAAVSGPGSFTGLRVGLAAIKALAEILRKPIAAVSLLEAVARAAPNAEGQITSVLDAGRGEVYAGVFEIINGRGRCVSESLATIAEFADGGAGQLVVTSDPRLAEILLHARVNVKRVDAPRADTIARLGFEKIQRGESVAPEVLDASYIRRSDAEIKISK